MKEEVLKSVSQPSQLFYAPFGLTVFNFVVSAYFIILLLVFNMMAYIVIPIISFIIIQLILILIGRKEPHIDNIILSRQNIKAHTKNMIRERGNKFAP